MVDFPFLLQSYVRYRHLFEERSSEPWIVEPNFPHEIRPESLYGSSGHQKENHFVLQENHLRFLMSSTAEQPDNSSRSSTFNIWLTILIAAMAAALLS
ncbi:uncharacterized protein CDAR_589681 [Caerostris darwini]|uniref:Uncharacterized protein n=1 Tax=Caerostris darwini TaxID=1538125 RepID=A0AAV4PH23_9ARAC|nr:uncharacterized protein CDAR_589681 [Caerostris darwini]